MDQPLPCYVTVVRIRIAFALVADLALAACLSANHSFRPNYAGPEPIMLRLVAAARACGFTEVHTGPPLIRSTPDEIGVRIEWLGEGRRWDCLLQWSRDNGINLAHYGIIYDRAPGSYPGD